MTKHYFSAALFFCVVFVFTGCEQPSGENRPGQEYQAPVLNVLPGNQCLSVSWTDFSSVEVFVGTGDEMPRESEGNVTLSDYSAVITGLTNNTAYNVWVAVPEGEYIKTSKKAIPVNPGVPDGKFASSEYIYELDGVIYSKYKNKWSGNIAESDIVYSGTIIFADGGGAMIIKIDKNSADFPYAIGAYHAVKVTYIDKLYKVKESTEAPEIPAQTTGNIEASFGETDTANITVGKLVVFDSNGGDTEASPQAIAVESGKTAGKLPIPPTKTNFQFDGWEMAYGSEFSAGTAVNSDVTVYARWIAETGGGEKTFSSIADMARYLESFYGDNRAENPVEIVLTKDISVSNMASGNDSLGALFEAFNGKYVTLDMSAVAGDTIADVVAGTEKIRNYKDCLVSIKLPAALVKIGDYSFNNCVSLKSVVFPDTLLYLGEGAFWGAGITEFTIPNTVTTFGKYIFRDCKDLESVNLSGLNKEIKDLHYYKFAGCSSLKNLTLPNEGLTTIGQYTFENCVELETVTLPVSLTSVGLNTFSGCTKLKTVIWTETGTNCYIGTGGTFKDCKSLKTLVIPEGVTKIINAGMLNPTNCLFAGSGLETITLPTTLSTIAVNTFKDAANLVEINILKPSTTPSFTGTTLSNVNAFTGTPISNNDTDTAHIYVPDEASVTAYKAVSNWITFANLISVKPAQGK
ncbi:MAG: leucine-rich repeat protein [Treponema sp.]|nr:leucine-rich repeat protein [Treponema sp.]